ncbi:MAG: 2-oxoglutarate dehydrogenase E1 component [Nitrosomonadaceae bacterium]|nr:2-oxoglutarate dehydrogenase E1 component [Nitrosomonadaceae bacterium]|tara:strand:+ start:13426 stop:16266 length:2841 start_codon:yes stop_codon:yes gene_type:complete
MIKELFKTSILYGANAPFIEALYEDYLQNSTTVPPEWCEYFDKLKSKKEGASKDVIHSQIIESFINVEKERRKRNYSLSQYAQNTIEERKQVSVLQIINAFRFQGVRQATLDPLKQLQKPYVPMLDPSFYGLNEEDMDMVFHTGSLVGPEFLSLRDILQLLQRIYCGNIGVEYMYINDTEQKRWIQARIEGTHAKPNFSNEYKLRILERVIAAEGLEKYLHTRYVGQKRFSGEGGESMVPLLDNLLQRAGKMKIQEVVIGMAHRGRLNVLINTLGKMPANLFKEFENNHIQELTAGDVKYHQGFSSSIQTPGGIMRATLAFNPSHLEIVNPVVEGSVRARQHRLCDREGKLVLPVLLHGDAAFSGQGVVMESLNLSQTRGYGTGGTVHVIINNQIGFTTSDVRDSRSTLYCTEVSKMIEAPIFHVNGDDPEAVVMVTEIALDFRMKFKKDVVIDMVCFRRLGHNEQDEPMVTQPLMYKIIDQHIGVRKLYADKLETEGVIVAGEADTMLANYRKDMDAGINPNKTIYNGKKYSGTTHWAPFIKPVKWNQKVMTGIPINKIKHLATRITKIPKTFKVHSRVQKILDDRRLMGEGKLPLDWGMAENLAYAGLLSDGFPIRISGQDSGRGTFFHRHAVLHNQNSNSMGVNDRTYIPLRNIEKEQPDIEIIDSMLSEEAVLAFEYGYATAAPNNLVVWEAQFGDFANGAQVVIDQFIASGEAKWGRLCGLVMILPHGYEGQGPEHSSGRIERYLQLCAEYNMQVCVPSTPSQMFHLLRRQMIRKIRKPLIIMSPKSMLRQKNSVSSLDDLAHGEFNPVIAENKKFNCKKVRRIIACSGKVYYDLLAYRKEQKIEDIVIVRIEQLYPFPHDEFQAEINRYLQAKELLWCQEEPGNQGAWHRIQHYLLQHLGLNQTLYSAMRPSSASPAAGYLAKHNFQKKELLADAFCKRI